MEEDWYNPIGLIRQSLNGTRKNESLYIMPNFYTATYVGPGPVPTLWHCITPGSVPTQVPSVLAINGFMTPFDSHHLQWNIL